MTLRRPAAHLPMGWRRSGDESQWETQSSKGESFLSVNRRAPRPRSAIEGRQVDGWLGQLHRMQGDTPVFCDQEPSTRSQRPYRTPSFSGVSSSCGSMKGSLTGSRESLQSEFLAQRRGSLERVHISQTPKKEQSQRSYVVPVKTGWLPIQRVMKVEDSQDHTQLVSPHSAAQVKLKQPITPTFLKSRGTVSLYKDDQAEKSQRKTWQTPDRSSPVIKQVADNETQKPGIWQALRRGWNINRLSGTRSSQPSTVIPPEPRREVPANRKASEKEPQQILLRTAVYGRPESVQRVFCGAPDPHREETRVEERPLRSPVPPPFEPYRRHSLEPSQIQTTSTTTTLVPRNKVGFSSITISSRKVSRSASLNTSDRPSGQTANSLNIEAMGPRKATIVKVTEQRTTVKPKPVVHQRKPTIIKVTEHKECYSPGTGYTMENISPFGAETEPVKSCEPAPAEVLEQEPKRPVIRKWSLGFQETLPQPQNKDQEEAIPIRWSSTPCLTLIQKPDPHQSPEEVLALNAAAIIANIKLQRKLSQKKTLPCNSEWESSTSPQGNTAATNGGNCGKVQNGVPSCDEPCAEPVSPTVDVLGSQHAVSLQEALRKSRPRFIARSQERVQKMRERRERSTAEGPQTTKGSQQLARSLNYNLSKSKEGAKCLKSNRPLTEAKRRKEEEKKKKEAYLTNRQRAELFKKKLLNQILHRSSN